MQSLRGHLVKHIADPGWASTEQLVESSHRVSGQPPTQDQAISADNWRPVPIRALYPRVVSELWIACGIRPRGLRSWAPCVPRPGLRRYAEHRATGCQVDRRLWSAWRTGPRTTPAGTDSLPCCQLVPCLLCSRDRRAAARPSSSGNVRRPRSVFGSPSTTPAPTTRTRVIRIVMVFASRSTSDQRSPSTSPRRNPYNES
jgi:hypothetical protein